MDTDRPLIDMIHPLLLIGSLLVGGVIIAAVHLAFGPPVTYVAAVTTTLLLPIVAFGAQRTAQHLPTLLRTARGLLGAARVYSRTNRTHRAIHADPVDPRSTATAEPSDPGDLR